MATINDESDDSRQPGETSITTESATTKPETPAAKKRREYVESTLKVARRQFRTSASAMQFWREQALDDERFRAGTWGTKSFQWPKGMKEKRDEQQRPAVTVNRQPGFIRQVTNQARQAHLRINVKPVGDRTDPKLAEVLQALIRNVEVDSASDWVYNTASDKQAGTGLGYLHLVTEYADEDADDERAFRLKVRLKRERRPFSIFPDVRADNPDFSDGKFLFKATDVDDDEFEEIAGKPPVTREQVTFATAEDQTGDWFPNGKNRIAIWFNREPKGEKKRRALLTSGQVVDYPEDEDAAAAFKEAQEKAGDPVLRDRWIQKHVMMLRTITATDILEETEWPAKGTGFFAVPGDEYEIEGERDWRGVTRDSKDPGRIYNVEVSALLEAVGQGQKAPVVGVRGQFGTPDSDMRKAWGTANVSPLAFLEYEAVDIDGKPAPPPTRITFDPPIQGVIEAIHQADEDYKTTAGFHDASLGERGPQESGKAINARTAQDELGSSHYLDSQRLSMASLGRQMIELFRVVYDVATVHRITGDDGRERDVMIFSGSDHDPRSEKYLKTHPTDAQPLTLPDGKTVVPPGGKIPFQLPDGVKELYDLSVGEFNVEVSANKDSGTRREQAVDMTMGLFKVLPPELAAKFLDLLFVMVDMPVAHQMAERAKLLLPPELQDQEGGEDLPPAALAKLAQAKQMIDQLGKQLQAATEALKTKQLETSSKERIAAAANASREKIAGVQEQADLIKTEAEIQAEQALADIRVRLEQFQSAIDMIHEKRMAERQQLHDASEADKNRLHDLRSTLLTAAVAPPPAPPTSTPPEGGQPA